jgi:hypothetical protein
MCVSLTHAHAANKRVWYDGASTSYAAAGLVGDAHARVLPSPIPLAKVAQ